MVIFHVDYTINDSHPKSPLKSQITIQITGHVVFFVPFSEISQVLAFPVYAGLSPGRLLALAPLGSALLAAWPAKPSTEAQHRKGGADLFGALDGEGRSPTIKNGGFMVVS